MKNYKKPPREWPPCCRTGRWYRRMAGRLFILSGVVLFVLAVVISGKVHP
jgi:hypothetical protein